MKVLVVTPFYPSEHTPYAGVFVHQQIQALRQLGVTPTVVRTAPWTPPGVKYLSRKWRSFALLPQAYTYEGVAVRVLRLPSLPRNGLLWLQPLILRRALVHLLSERHYDVVHAHFAFPVGRAATNAIASLARRPKVILTVHGSDVLKIPEMGSWYYREVREALRASDLVVAVSQSIRDRVIELCPDARVECLYTGVDCDRFSRLHTGNEVPWPVPCGAKVVLYVGNLLVTKGLIELLEAFSLVRAKLAHEEIHLVLVGDGPLRTRLSKMSKDMGLSRYTHFMGAQPNSVIPSIMAKCNLLVLPSHYEGLGMVTVEAQATGLPVIATQVGGIPEVVHDGQSGILVPPRDAQKLADAIARVLSDPELSRKMSLKGREIAKSCFDLYHNAAQLLERYVSLVGKGEGGLC